MVDNNAKAWLDEVKDALFDAEDPLNVIDYEFFECEFEAEFESQTKVSNFFNTSLSSFNRQIESRVIQTQALDKLEYLAIQKVI